MYLLSHDTSIESRENTLNKNVAYRTIFKNTTNRAFSLVSTSGHVKELINNHFREAFTYFHRPNLNTLNQSTIEAKKQETFILVLY